MKSATVAAIIPAYNGAGVLTRAIDSILCQSRPVSEVIVVDDGSTDNTSAVVRAYGNRITYIFQENAGASAARNRGVAAAQSEWIAFLDNDDEWLPRKIELQLDALAQQPAEICCGPFWIYRTDGSRELARPAIPLLPAIRLRNQFPPSVAMVSRRAFLDHGGFREDLRASCEDWELFCRMAQDCACTATAAPLLNYYESDSSVSLNPRIMLPATLSIVDTLLIGLRGPARAIWRRRIVAAIHYRGSVSFRHRHGSGLHHLLLSLLSWPVPDIRMKTLAVELLELLKEPHTLRRRLSGVME